MQQKDGCFHSSDKFRIFWYWKLVKSIALKQYFFISQPFCKGAKAVSLLYRKNYLGVWEQGLNSNTSFVPSKQTNSQEFQNKILSFKNRTIIALYCFISLRETFSLEILHVFSNPQEEFMDENLTKTKSSGFWSLCSPGSAQNGQLTISVVFLFVKLEKETYNKRRRKFEWN